MTLLANPTPMPQLDGVSHDYTTVDGLRIHYAEAGAGEPLILVHGWPQHWYAWHRLIEPLSRTYRVICPDIRGLGWSEGPKVGYSSARLGRDIVELMDQLRIPRARLVGHDWGGAAGYRACIDFPDRFSHYVALATLHPWTAKGATPGVFLRPWHLYALALPGARTAVKSTRLPDSRLRVWRHHGEFTPDETRTYLDIIHGTVAANATARFYRNLVFHEVPAQLRQHPVRLTVPTLHLNGADDHLTRGLPHSYREYAADMTMEDVPDCGHFIAEEQPTWMLNRVQEFLIR